jgi:O-antigen/teichoic acid export membrane protein
MPQGSIAKNTSFFTLALIIQKIISFVYFALIAKYLGPVDLGKYYFAISFTTIFGIFIDIGVANVLIREIARLNNEKKQKNSQAILSTVIALKIPMAFISSLLIIALINYLDYSSGIRNLVYLSIICVILDSFTATFFAVSRGFHNMIFESIASVIFQSITFIFGFFVVKFNLNMAFLMLGLVSASTFNIFYSSFLITKKYKLSIKPIFHFASMRELIILALPFGTFVIFQKFYTYIDTVLLNFFSGDRYVGIYQIPFKLIFALQFLPMAFIASLYPVMSKAYKEDRHNLSLIFEKAIRYLLIISLPISLGVASLSDKLIFLFDENYASAITPMIIIMLSLPFIFLNFPIGSFLNATEKQKINTLNMIIAAITAIILNLFLIPKFNVIGASITVLLSNILMFILGMRSVSRITQIRYSIFFSFFLKSFISALCMAFVIIYFKHEINLLILIALSAVIYFILMIAIKGLNKEDLKQFFLSFKKTM